MQAQFLFYVFLRLHDAIIMLQGWEEKREKPKNVDKPFGYAIGETLETRKKQLFSVFFETALTVLKAQKHWEKTVF